LPAFASLATAMVPIVEELTPILSEVMEQLAPILEDVAGIIPELLQGFLPLLPVIGQIAEVFLQLVGALLPPFAALLQALIPIIEFAVEAVQKFVVPLVEQLAPILTQIIELFAPLLEAILPIFLVLLEALLQPTLDLIEAMIPFYEVVLPLLADVIENIVVPALQSFEEFLAVFLPQATAQAEELGLFPFLSAFEVFSAGIKNGANGLEVTIAEMVNSIIESFEGAVKGALRSAKKFAPLLTLLNVPLGMRLAKLDVESIDFGEVDVPERIYEFPEVNVTGISDAGRRSMAQLEDLRGPSATFEEAMQTEIQRFAAREGFLPGGFRSSGIQGLFGGDLPSPTTRARGGLVMRGNPFIVGEMGPELFIPQDNGEIIPNHRLGGGGNTYNITVNSGVGDPVRIGEEVVNYVRRYERASGKVFASA